MAYNQYSFSELKMDLNNIFTILYLILHNGFSKILMQLFSCIWIFNLSNVEVSFGEFLVIPRNKTSMIFSKIIETIITIMLSYPQVPATVSIFPRPCL